MKVKRLLLCLFMSLALVVTFIPMISFGEEGDMHDLIINDGDYDLVSDEDGYYYAELEHGSLWASFDNDEEKFAVAEGEDAWLSIDPEWGWAVKSVKYSFDGETYSDADWNDKEGDYEFEVPVCSGALDFEDVYVVIEFKSLAHTVTVTGATAALDYYDEEEDINYYYAQLEYGKVYGLSYDEDAEEFYAIEDDDLSLYVEPEDSYIVDSFECYTDEGDVDVSPDYDESIFNFTMPGEDVTIDVSFVEGDDPYDDPEFDENAEADLVLVGGRDLVFDFSDEENSGFQNGDQIIITYSDDSTVTFVYGKHIEYDDQGEAEVDYGFYYDDIRLGLDYTPIAGETSLDLTVWYYGEEMMNFDIDFSFPVEVITNVKSISFAPQTVTVFSEDIKVVEDGQTYYYLDQRHRFTYDGNECFSPFDEGDSITVNYMDGTSEVYKYKTTFTTSDGPNYDYFVNGDNTLWPDVDDDCWNLVPGKNNTVTIYYDGASTTFNVFVETPAIRAQKAEAARQGTLDSKMPAVKIAKPKAAAKAITVKWKKVNKKQLKKAKVSNIEVWVSTSKAFPRGATIEKVVGKKKASVKVKGLKKGTTYFAKVRTIKYVNGAKVVGKWSKVKKIKTKK